MGQVWLAEQTAPVHRQVALKLIRADHCDTAMLQRFQSERQSLAIMDHPSIAKVFDAGATPDGQPYLVMEYVHGQEITRYCDERKLKIEQRLDLFIKVCEGVQHAHQKAILHRDLKPANILVVEVDGLPTPRIIDFGIAKSVAIQRSADEMLTQVGGWVGTPGYMSPEQADPRIGDVDTRTDVYSLGAVLYVLLTGSLPFDLKQWREQPYHEVLRKLREDDPLRPSTKVGSDGTRLRVQAEQCRMEPQGLVRLLRGDLDWIAMKALERDRARRYDSASALAADVRRYLNNEPVLAAPPSAAYRAGKFVRRHRAAVAAASAIAALLLLLAVSMSVQAVRIARERDRANREAVAATSVSDFLVGLFKVSDPSEARGNSITAREILDRGAKQVGTGLADQPEVQARLKKTMGEVYRSLGLYAAAQPLLEEALETRRRILGAENPSTLASLQDLAGNLERQGQYEKAEKITRETLAARRRLLGLEHADTLAAMNLEAGLLYDLGRFAEAERLQRELMDIQRRTLKPRDPALGNSLGNLALDLVSEGRLAEAEKSNRESLDILGGSLGREHPATLTTMTHLSRVLREEGKYGEAERLIRETLVIQRRILGDRHHDTLWSMEGLARIVQDQGRHAEAERLWRETLDLRIAALGKEHPDTLLSMNYLAALLDDERRYAEAEQLYRKALAIQQRVVGVHHPETAGTEYNLACNAALRGRKDGAIAFLERAIEDGMLPADMLNIQQDDDLKSLHGDPRFDAIVKAARERAAAATAVPPASK